VIGVGSTTQVTTTTTDPEGAQTVEQLPRTLLTLSLDQDQVERVLFAQTQGELAFSLLTPDSKIQPGPGTTASDLFKG
jgi:pilus assembly protein CpaB